MLPHAQYRHSDYCTASHAGVTGVTTTSEHGYTSFPSGQTMRPLILKGFFNHSCDRYQKVSVATTPADKTVEAIYRLGSDLQSYFGQHPPPLQKSGASPPWIIKSKGPPPKLMDSSPFYREPSSHLMWSDKTKYALRSDRLSLALQHPPPPHKKGASPPGIIKSKGPPPKLMDSSPFYREPSSHLMWPDITEYALRSDRLSLALQHPPPLQKNGASPPGIIKSKGPPPTKGRTTGRRARRKLNCQQPLPKMWGSARHTVIQDTHLRPILEQMRTTAITAQGFITFFTIEVGAASYDYKFLHLLRSGRELKLLQCLLRFIQGAILEPLKVKTSRAIYSCEKLIYTSNSKAAAMLANLKNQNRQILPTHRAFNDQNCLVGKICLASEAHRRKQNMP